MGAKVGEDAEKALDQGVPRDDGLFYCDLLKKGRALVITSVESDDMATAVRAVCESTAHTTNQARDGSGGEEG
ncbi:MAG: hypothetical protein ACE14M_08795 [Terriglobales bacterium]